MKRIYYGSVTCTVNRGSDPAVHNICAVTFAESEDEAKGWIVSQVLAKHPGGKLSVVQMFAVPDDWIADAAGLLRAERQPC